MTEPDVTLPSADELSVFNEEQLSQGPLMSGTEWSVMRTLDPMREALNGFFGPLDEQERLDYVRLQKAYLQQHTAFEEGVRLLGSQFEDASLAALRARLKALAGKEVDPRVARIHTRYLTSGQTPQRVPRALDTGREHVAVASLTLWEAACMNYGGLTGWSYPGHDSLEDASYLDPDVGINAADFIALVRELDLGTQLQRHLDEALEASSFLGTQVLTLANAELEFALIEALRTPGSSHVDQHKYRAVMRAFAGEIRFHYTEEVQMFIPYGQGSDSGGNERYGLLGVYTDRPLGDYLSASHVVFSVQGCAGAFSYFPNRPGGAFRHHDDFPQAARDFYVAFQAFYLRGEVDWLYQAMSLSDYARLKARPRQEPMPEGLNPFAMFLYRLTERVRPLGHVKHIGYQRQDKKNVPAVSLYRFHIARCRANLKELANATPGVMPTLIEFIQTLFSEIINLLLIPAPGPLKGLGRLRAFSMFVTLGQTWFEALLKGRPVDVLQGAVDTVDLLISSRLSTRLALTARRRHQALYDRFVQHSQPLGTDERQNQTDAQWLAKMLGDSSALPKTLDGVLSISNTSRETLAQVWDGAPPSASLVEATQRFNADRLIEWVGAGIDTAQAPPLGSFEVLAPLLTQLDSWPSNTALVIASPQGVTLRRYSRSVAHTPSEVITVTLLDNHHFAHSAPRQVTVHLHEAVLRLLPDNFHFSEQSPSLAVRLTRMRHHLALLANAHKLRLFEALTQFLGKTRTEVGQHVRSLLPDAVGSESRVPAVVEQLQALHPEVSLPRLLETLRQHPLSAHQQEQLLNAQLQPQALYNALRAARHIARREAMVDGVFHGRRFNVHTQGWAQVFADGLLRDVIGKAVDIRPAAAPTQGRADAVVVLDHGEGRYAAYHAHAKREGALLRGVDSFYQAIMEQLSISDLARLKLPNAQDVAGLRYLVGGMMTRNRAVDGTFSLYHSNIEAYAYKGDASPIELAPGRLGLYQEGPDRYVFIEGRFYRVSQAESQAPWRIDHPGLEYAYSPRLIHNGVGAWRHEWENPLTWDGQQPFYRLGVPVRSVNPDSIEMIQRVSQVNADILRRVHVRSEPPPAMLMETVARFDLQQRVQAGVSAGADFFDRVLGELDAAAAGELVGSTGISRADQVRMIEARVHQDRASMEQALFQALSLNREASTEPLARVIQRDFPSLPALLADDVLAHATAAERTSLQGGRVPLRLAQEARWLSRDVRINRACEGLYLPAARSLDSDRVLLHALVNMPNWPQDVRIEIRENGALIDSVGNAQAAIKTILQRDGGLYQSPVDEQSGKHKGDLLTVVLTVLQHNQVEFVHADGIEELRLAIAQRMTVERNLVAQVLGMPERQPWFIAPQRLADGRIGYPLSGKVQRAATQREQIAQLRALFTGSTDVEVAAMLDEIGPSISDRQHMIDYLVKEREVLNNTLGQWCRQAGHASSRDEPLLRKREQAMARIQRCWAKEASSHSTAMSKELNLDGLDLADLPEIGAHFGHVEVLSLKGNRLSQFPARFLRCFPALRRLYLNNNHFEQIPRGLSGLQHLSALYLSNNRLKLRLGDVIYLNELTQLRTLDLSSNPLRQGQRLSLGGLKELRYLNLRNTQLDSLPKGASTLRMLTLFDLSDNRLSVLTSSDLFIFPEVWRAMKLQGNPLSEGTKQLLRRYRDRPNCWDITFGLEPLTSVPQAQADRWLVVLPFQEAAHYKSVWAELQQQQMAEGFFTLLANIAQTTEFTSVAYRSLREALSYRVWRLIEGACQNGRLMDLLLQSPLDSLSEGLNAWLLQFNDLELAFYPVQMLAGNVEGKGPDFVNYYRALRRYASITQHVARVFHNQGTARVYEQILGYRIALANTLNLPCALPGRFASPSSVPDHRSASDLRITLLGEETLMLWPDILELKSYWVEFLERKYPHDFESTLREYRRALELATENVSTGVMTDGQYLTYVDTLRIPMEAAKAKLVRRLTRREWNYFVN